MTTRRDFLKITGAVAVAVTLPEGAEPQDHTRHMTIGGIEKGTDIIIQHGNTGAVWWKGPCVTDKGSIDIEFDVEEDGPVPIKVILRNPNYMSEVIPFDSLADNIVQVQQRKDLLY